MKQTLTTKEQIAYLEKLETISAIILVSIVAIAAFGAQFVR